MGSTSGPPLGLTELEQVHPDSVAFHRLKDSSSETLVKHSTVLPFIVQHNHRMILFACFQEKEAMLSV